jgi:glutaryl-CoA dehydrogenase
LRNEGKATTAQISMAKRNNVDMAIHIAREARQILGNGNIRRIHHATHDESRTVITYEGTHDIHLLITGMDITGIPAFK